ncbi:ATP-dependent DNA helicase [Frankliniella fusca]|uniref:ATP-dependent DNA helicase n=1 Tax=Frankliniella fusca TaxID=407009 RepID=A0AAE1L8G0_9NEOP|nr:ATP-dependent DNA helicase [Frankliniella fusca]
MDNKANPNNSRACLVKRLKSPSIFAFAFYSARDIDACVHLGTNLHAKSCPQNHNGFLFPHEIHETFTLPNNVDVYLQAATEAKFIGPIHNIEGFGDEIVSALTTYFQTSRCGILTCNEYSFAILSADDEYWIFDSHAKNMEGKCDSEGFAVLISFSCINELVLYLQQNFNNFSTYSITEIKFDMQIPVFDLLGDSNQNQPGLPVSNHIGDSNQNQPGLCVLDHLGDSNQNQPGLPVFDHLGDSNQNQPGLPVFDRLGDSNQNQPGLSVFDRLGDSNQNQPGLPVSSHIGDSNQNRPGLPVSNQIGDSNEDQPGFVVSNHIGDSYQNQPGFGCPIGDSIQNHPGTDYKQDSKKNLPNSFTGPIGDSSLSQPVLVRQTGKFTFASNEPQQLPLFIKNTMSNEPKPKIQLTSSNSQPEKTTNLHPTHLKSMQISKNMNKKRKMQIKLENSRMEKAKRTRLDINGTLANETVQESKESSPVKLQSKKQEAFRKYYNDKLKNDPEFKKNNLERVKSKLANDEDYKLKNLENVKTRLHDESSRLKNLENVKTRLKNDDYRLRILENVKSRLEVDVIYQKSTSLAKKKYEEKFKCNTEKYSEKLENNKKHKHNKENDSFEDSKQKVIDQYFIEIKEGPTWICSCCGHLNFKKSMSLLNEFPEDSLFQLKTICTANVPTDNKYMVCHTCRRYLISQTVPNNAVVNGLSFPPIPEVLQGLTQLEERLLAVRQPFMKIIELSKYAGPQYGLKGSCVNVPTDLNSTIPKPFLSNFKGEWKISGQDIDNCLSHDEDDEPCQNNSNWIPLKNEAGYIKLRSKPKTIRFRNYNPLDDEYNYFREQVMLYHPWHNEQNIIDNAKDIYEKYVTTINVNREKYNFNMSIDLDKTMKEINTHIEDCSSDDEAQDICLSDDFKIFELGTVDSDIALEIPTMKTDDDTPKFGTFTVPKAISNQEYIDLLSSLNEKQTKYHDNFLHLIKSNTKEQFFHFISGPGGVGKSTLLNAITHTATKFWSHQIGNDPADVHIILSAPTGKAAFNIQGQTIHSIFGLDFDLKKELKTKMSANKRNTLMYKLRKLKILVIDEISMVSYDMMEVINLRLQQIFENHLPFGSVSLICLGDFNQLPPIYSTPVYQPSKDTMSILSNASNEITVIHSEHGSNETFYMSKLWSLFELYELTQFMRQKNDLKFAAALLRFANGNTTDEDDAMFQSHGADTSWTLLERVIKTMAISRGSTKTISRKQFPLVPAQAITSYKSQSSTYKKILVFPEGMNRRHAYTTYSRAENLEGLMIRGKYKKPTPPTKFDMSIPVMEKMRKEHRLLFQLKFPQEFQKPYAVFHNTRSLNMYLPYIKSHQMYTNGDILMFVETRFKKK